MSETDCGTNLSIDARQAVADDAHAGWRLDRFLASSLPDFSRSRLQQLLETSAVSLEIPNQPSVTIRDANHRVKLGDVYTVSVPASRPALPQGQAIALDALYEDKDLIVINKQAGLVV